MNNSNKRKEYMRDIYSKNWSKKREQYGVEQYDKDLINEIIKKNKNCKVLEIAIGDGFPYTDALDKMGYQVHGIDISPTHVDMVKNTHPNVQVIVGDAEDLDYGNSFFEIVFCFRSTWYFSDLMKSIGEMIRVVKKNGLIMFDIQNSCHPIHQKMIIKNDKQKKSHPIINVIKRYFKNVLKILVRPVVFHGTDWSLKNHPIIETPTNPYDVIKYLNNCKNIKYTIFGVEWDEPFTFLEIIKNKDINELDKLVFKVLNY